MLRAFYPQEIPQRLHFPAPSFGTPLTFYSLFEEKKKGLLLTCSNIHVPCLLHKDTQHNALFQGTNIVSELLFAFCWICFPHRISATAWGQDHVFPPIFICVSNSWAEVYLCKVILSLFKRHRIKESYSLHWTFIFATVKCCIHAYTPRLLLDFHRTSSVTGIKYY